MKKPNLAERADARWMDTVAVDRYLADQDVGRPLTYAERGEVARRQHRRWVEVTARKLRIAPADVRDALTSEYRTRQRERRTAA